MRKHYTKQFKNKALDRVRKGEKRTEIAKDMRIGTNTLTKWIKEAGLRKRSSAPSYSLEFIQRVIKDIRQGMSIREASRKHGASIASIHNWITEDYLENVAKIGIKTGKSSISTPKKVLGVIFDNRLYAVKQVQITLTADRKLLFRIMSR